MEYVTKINNILYDKKININEINEKWKLKIMDSCYLVYDIEKDMFKLVCNDTTFSEHIYKYLIKEEIITILPSRKY